jgi:hypothetical protein
VPGMGEWVIPEDGIIDALAVKIAASGKRRVRLTRTERRLAAALIIARGGSAYQVHKRLGVSPATAHALVISLTAAPAELGEVA